MNCKGCGKKISGNDYKKVADWTFCIDCFDELMTRFEQKSEPVKNAPNDLPAKDTPEKKVKSNTCQICKIKIEKGEEKRLGIWTLCESCHRDMTFRLENKTISEVPDDTQNGTYQETDEETSEITESEGIKTNQTICCSCCGRRILAVAAKNDGDDSLCPDCFYNELREKS